MEKHTTLPIREKDTASVNFLYGTLPGRAVLKLLIQPGFSRLVGRFLDSRLSCGLISGFIRRNGIGMEAYQPCRYGSFNEFFTRKIRSECRPVDAALQAAVAPCDGKLTAYRIDDAMRLRIKQSVYDLPSLLDDAALARDYAGGVCLIYRLTTDDYHRYAFVDDGELLENRRIPGVLHTVRPVALERYPVFSRNAREFARLRTRGFGEVIQMEVGALCVGRIRNHEKTRFVRGEEKGMFEFGGSTVVVLYRRDTVRIDEALFANTQSGLETVVRLGERVGVRA